PAAWTRAAPPRTSSCSSSRRPPTSSLSPYTTLFRSRPVLRRRLRQLGGRVRGRRAALGQRPGVGGDLLRGHGVPGVHRPAPLPAPAAGVAGPPARRRPGPLEAARLGAAARLPRPAARDRHV